MSINDDEPIQIEWIEKFLRNEATEQECMHVEDWMKKMELSAADLRQMIALPEGVKFLLTIDDDAEWSRLKSRIPWQRSVHLSFSWYKVAAAVALLVGISALFVLTRFNSGQDQQFFVTADQDNQQIALPDNSKVYLRKGATIRYQESFAKDNRHITLSGEGFFEITRDTLHPFTIAALNCRVRVLGTSFNVRTDSSETDVIVSTGKVALDQNGFEPIYLYPGDKGAVKKGVAALKVTNLDANFLSWKTGELVFENTSLNKAIDALQNHFQATIVIAQPVEEWPAYTSRFDHPTLEEVLTEMQQVLPLTYTQVADKIIITLNN
jgi:transmembrane sensor